MAIGIKIIDFAIVPHHNLSAKYAITKPKNALNVGTTNNHPKLFNIALLNSGSFAAQT